MNWRAYGNTTFETWQRVIATAGGPAELASRAAYDAASPHSRLCLAMLGEESSWGTEFNLNTPGNRNPLNLRPATGGGYMKYGSWAEGIRAWRERITSQTYKNGIYAKTPTLSDLIYVYAPPTDSNDTEGYIRHVADRIASYPPEFLSMPKLHFGNVKHPPFVDRYISDAQNGAWDYLGPREPVGVCQHSMVGSLWGTDGWFRRGQQSNGLTDYGIGGSTDGEYDGVIFRWNDPRGNRSGWANGGSDGLEGDGPAFVRKFGPNGINRFLVSIERSDGGNIHTPMSPKQFNSICSLSARWFDQAKVPWDRFPVNPAYNLVTHFLHFEFATKNCAFPPVNDRIDDIQNRTRAILKAGQLVESEGPSIPPATPVEPDKGYPHRWTLDEMGTAFGSLIRHNPKGSKTVINFDPEVKGAIGVISNAWIQRSAGHFKNVNNAPKPLGWYVLQGSEEVKQDIVLFERDWSLFRPDTNVAWKWIR